MSWVAVALAVGQAIYGKHQQDKANREAKKIRKEDQKLIDEQRERQKSLDAFGRPFLDRAGQNYGLVENYLRQVASGNRELTEQALAPQINQASDLYRGSVAAQRNVNPRSGANAAMAGQMGQQFQGGINNMLFGARTDAMNQLGTLAGNQATLGLGAMGQGAGLTNSMLQYGLQARDQMFNQGMMAGQAAMGQWDYWTRMGMNAYNNYQNRRQAPGASTYQTTNFGQPGGDLSTFGKGSTLGFGGTTPGSTYSGSTNIYGKSS